MSKCDIKKCYFTSDVLFEWPLIRFLYRLMLSIYICLRKVRNIVKPLCWHWATECPLVGNFLTLIKILDKCDSTCNLMTPILKPNFYTNWLKTRKDVLRTQLNIYGGAFLLSSKYAPDKIANTLWTLSLHKFVSP